ncbi:CSC1-like protein At4g02900 [Durusdinium trenchii]|uniref:CSC1-like protein At4g02900 n=1 Tax=Durusdinium trenchii TaxID=1381693 RepID=A0ABP0HHJ3_9DINO
MKNDLRLAAVLIALVGAKEACETVDDVSLLQSKNQKFPTLGKMLANSAAFGERAAPTTYPNKTNDQAEEVMGVKGNEMGDEHAFFSGLISNAAMICCAAVGFTFLRRHYPLVYSFNVLEKIIPEKAMPEETLLGWLKLGFQVETDEELVSALGLDSVLMLEFISLSLNILLRIGLVGFVVFCPLHYFFGWGGPDIPALSKMGMGNVVNLHPWLYYLHALYCAYVCYTVKTLVYDAQEKFLARRFKWLKTLPHPRSRTVLVEGIPEEFVSEDKVREFFGLALGNDVVEEVHLLKKTKKLQQLVAYRDHSIDCKKQAEFQFEKTEKRPEHYKVNVGQVPEKVDSIEFYTDEVKKTEEAIADEYHRIQEESKKVGGVNCRNGFVTFKDRKSVELAKELDYHSDAYTWVLTEPPDLEMVRWDELRVSDDVTETAQELVGYACVFGLYAGFVPICLWITNLANSIHMGFLQPMWASLAPTMGLTLFLSFLPTVLLLVIDNCYKLRSSSRAQEMLLRWYFWFQVIFVLLVTAVGNDFWDFVKDVAQNPLNTPHLLADQLPKATHFYMNWIVVQWSTHFINLTRYINLSKYLGFSTVYTEEEAKKKAEPEDQDYYGFGARGARWCINLLVGIVFGTLNPAIPLLAAVNFVVCRAVYGYLIVAAETRKPDLGGNFWVMNMRHVLIGTMLYCILMTGVFLDRAPTVVPAAVSVTCLIWIIQSYNHFQQHFRWEALPFVEMMYKDKDMIAAAAEEAEESFEQPEIRHARTIAANLNSD